MPDQNIFNGSSTYIPSVNVSVNTSALTPTQIGAPLVPGIMGICEGGTPNTAITLYTPQQAMSTLRSGDLLDAVLRCFQPSDFVTGASKIIVVRVNPAVQASGTLADNSAGNTISLLSTNYGILDNNISVNIAAGTTQGTKTTVSYNGTGANPGTQALTFVTDNILRNSFTLHYIGAGATATATINETTLSTTTTIGGAENLSIAFSTFSTVGQLVSYINTTFPTVYAAVVSTVNPNDPTLNGLDHITTQDIKTSAFQVTANVYAICNAITASGIVTATRAPSTTGLIPKNQTVVLASGSEGTTTNTNWQNAINTMAAQPVDIEVVLSSDNVNIWPMLSTSVNTTSTSGLQARRGLVGTASGQSESTISTVITEVSAVNNDRIACVMQGINDTDPLSGNTKLFPAYVVAAQIAGLLAGTPLGNAITFEEMKGISCEWNPTTADLQTMIAGGILPLQFTPTFNYIRVVRGISTWLKDNNFFRVELATGFAVDRVIKDIMVGLQPLIGSGISQFTLYQIQSKVDSILRQELAAGLIVGSAATPLGFSSITVTGSGDTATVAFTAAFIVPTNFINVNVTATSFQGIISSQVAA